MYFPGHNFILSDVQSVYVKKVAQNKNRVGEKESLSGFRLI